jgi:anti-sigma regulatory factor (Ser/Thr protein kinase)
MIFSLYTEFPAAIFFSYPRLSVSIRGKKKGLFFIRKPCRMLVGSSGGKNLGYCSGLRGGYSTIVFQILNCKSWADVSMLNTIFRNLISNALKFTDAGGEVTISSVLRERQVEIAVADTGCGIDEQGWTKLFRIDTQYTNVGTAGEQGTGLGLILCKDLVEKQGGHISVESQAGTGATFRFTLPAKTTPIEESVL